MKLDRTPRGHRNVDGHVGSTTSPLDVDPFKLNSYGEFEDQAIQLPAGTQTIKQAIWATPV